MKYIFILILIFSINNAVGQKLILNELDCQISEVGKQQIAQIVEYEFRFYESFLNISRDVEIQVNIYGNHDVFKTTQSIISTSRTNSAFYSKKHNQIFINYREGRTEKKVLSVIAHESNHFILRHDGTRMPKWINEGMSEYFETAYVDANQNIAFGEPSSFINFINTSFEEDKVNLKQFIGWSDKKWTAVNKNKFYSYRLSWAIINYLFVNEHEETVKQILGALKVNPDNSRKIVEQNYEGGIDQLENDMRIYYQNKYKSNQNANIEVVEDLDVEAH